MQTNSQINNMHKFIKDPIYGEIYIGEDDYWFFDLINTREFKRLKYVRQLGETPNVFFSANHSRYTHSIGVYWLTKVFLNHLKPEISKEDMIAIKVAGLLHDTGHGPRSHSFEKLLDNFNHEEMTCRIINDSNSEINKILKKKNIDPKLVTNIIKHQNVPPFYYQIISSQIDADRLDYIVRDAYFVGSNNTFINTNLVIQWSAIVDNKLVFLNKAINSIESILFTRYQLFKQIYLNKKVLCYEQIITSIFKRLRFLSNNNFKFVDKYNLFYLMEPIIKNQEYSIELFSELNDETFDVFLKGLFVEKDDILKKLLNSYFYNNEFICKNIKINKVSNKNEFFYSEINVCKKLFDNKEPILIYHNNEIKDISYFSSWLKSWKDNKFTYYFMLKK